MQRNLYQDDAHMEPGVVTLFAKVTFGNTGAPTLTRGKGIQAVTRTGAGVFRFDFGAPSSTGPAGVDVYNAVLGVKQPTFQVGAQPAAPALEVTSIGTNNKSVTVTLRAPGAAAAATDPASGEVGYFEFVLSNSSAP